MGKLRAKELRKAVKSKLSSGRIGKGGGGSGDQLKKTVGKISAEISAISLGPPRAKILKKAGGGGASSSLLSSNFASRLSVLNKKKKKVTFCQNLLAEELKEKEEGDRGAKQYFKVVHPSAIGKKIGGKGEKVEALIPEREVLKESSVKELRKIIKSTVKNKKIRLKARNETFKRKMELLKQTKQEIIKAKQRQQTVIVGDLNPILEALPDLGDDGGEEEKRQLIETELMTIVEDQRKFIPKKNKHSVKKTQQAILDSMKLFKASGVTAGAGVPSK